jgi:hypothetical protein
MDSCVRHGNTQCCLKDLTDLMFSLSPNQKKFLEDIEFHKFMGISYSTNDLPRNLTWELVSVVDVEKGTLEIDGMSFNIEESVQRLLPVPRGSIEYNYKADDSEDDNLFELKDALCCRFTPRVLLSYGCYMLHQVESRVVQSFIQQVHEG